MEVPPTAESNSAEPELPKNQSLLTTILSLVAQKITALVGEIISLEATLTDENITPLPNKKINFYSDKSLGSRLTDTAGKAQLEWDTSSWLPGVYTISAQYEGDETTKPASAEIQVTLQEKAKEMPAKVKHRINIKNEQGLPVAIKLKHKEELLEELEEGTQNVTVLIEQHPVTRIEFKNLKVAGDLELGLSIPAIASASEIEFEDVYAINPEMLEFEEAMVSSIAQAPGLYKCKEWDFLAGQCLGTWQEVMQLTVGEEYSFKLTKDDPGFAEGNKITLPIPALQRNASKHVLAKVFNEEALDYDREYALLYLTLHGNFSNLRFYDVTGDKEAFTMRIGNVENEDVRGLSISNNNFVIQVVHCDEFKKFCKFRINGVPTPELYPSELLTSENGNSFIFDRAYFIKVNTVRVNQCNTHRFCHLGYEGYHAVNVSIEKRDSN